MVNIKRFLGLKVISVIGGSRERHVVVAAGQFTVARFTYNPRAWADFKQAASQKAEYAVDVITRREVFFYHSGRDCDGVEYGSGCAYKNIHEARESIEDAYEWADGPMSFTRITRKQYEEAESYSRDRFAEAAGY